MKNIFTCIEHMQQGKPIIIVDSKNRENEADLVASAQHITLGTMEFIIKHSSGLVCMSSTADQFAKLQLSKLKTAHHKTDAMDTPFIESFESSSGITTGVSSMDRLHSIKAASNIDARAKDIVSPGHILALQAHPEGLNKRLGHTEASVEMCKIAGLLPSAVISEIPDNSGRMLTNDNIEFFAKTYRVPMVTIEEIKKFVDNNYTLKPDAQSKLPTAFGDFNLHAYKLGTKEHVVISMGDIQGAEKLPIRIHSRCLTGESFSSLKCDCEQQLQSALSYIANKGRGMIVWLDEEGRNIGLTNKIKAYALQDQGMNTIEANIKLNLPSDNRNFKDAIGIIKHFNIESAEIITNNPQKIKAIKEAVKSVSITSLPSTYNKHNVQYLNTKKEQLKHSINIVGKDK